jgi:hypothetical protein
MTVSKHGLTVQLPNVLHTAYYRPHSPFQLLEKNGTVTTISLSNSRSLDPSSA